MKIPLEHLQLALGILAQDDKFGRHITVSDLEECAALSPRQVKRRQKMSRCADPAIAAIYSQVPVIEDLLGEKCEVDHIFPISKGDKHAADNLQIVPRRINQLKSDKVNMSYLELNQATK